MTTVDADTIRRSIEVPLPRERAFLLFTERTSTWWPFATHSVAGEAAEMAIIEPRVGGRVYERARDGSEHDWGELTVWEPPERFALSWTLDPSCAGTVVEVRFTPVGSGTRVELEHRGWRDASSQLVEGYAGGWEHVLRTFAGRAASLR
jgi:Activator of Hsp90 ATPase homolog 1-like protein